MGLSRRQFTKEFKLAAIERLERGAAVVAATSYRKYRKTLRNKPCGPEPPQGLYRAGHRQDGGGAGRGHGTVCGKSNEKRGNYLPAPMLREIIAHPLWRSAKFVNALKPLATHSNAPTKTPTLSWSGSFTWAARGRNVQKAGKCFAWR